MTSSNDSSPERFPEHKKTTKPEHWAEWFEFCAIDRCSEPTKTALGRLAQHRFLSAIKQAGGTSGGGGDALAHDYLRTSKTDPLFNWREVEIRYWYTDEGAELDSKNFVPDAAKIRKRFHERRAASLESDLAARDYLESRVTHWIKDIAKKVRRDFNRPLDSTQAPLPGEEEESGRPSRDLPDSSICPDDEAAAKDFAELFIKALNGRERALMLAGLAGIPSDHPAVFAAAGCGKSQAYACVASAQEKLRGIIAKAGLSQVDIPPLTGSRLEELLKVWAESEKDLAPLLQVISPRR